MLKALWPALWPALTPRRRNVPELAEAGFRVYSIDLLGYGYSSKPDPYGEIARGLNGENGRTLADVEVGHNGALATCIPLPASPSLPVTSGRPTPVSRRLSSLLPRSRTD